MTTRTDLLYRLRELQSRSPEHRHMEQSARRLIAVGDLAGAATLIDSVEEALHPALAAGGRGAVALPFFAVHDDTGGTFNPGTGVQNPWPVTVWTPDHECDDMSFGQGGVVHLVAGFWLLGAGLDNSSLSHNGTNEGKVSFFIQTDGPGPYIYPAAGLLGDGGDIASRVELADLSPLTTSLALLLVPTTVYQVPDDSVADIGFDTGTMTEDFTWTSVWLWGLKLA